MNWTTEGLNSACRATVTVSDVNVVLFGDETGIRHILLHNVADSNVHENGPVLSPSTILRQGSRALVNARDSRAMNIAEGHVRRAVREMSRYLSGTLVQWSFPFDPIGGTPWERAVWRVLREVPFGELRTYGWVAKRLGAPRAYRAVGRAVGKNPLPIIVPCHRIVPADGSLGGFSSGPSIKRVLLALEGSVPPFRPES